MNIYVICLFDLIGVFMEISVFNVPEITNNDIYILMKNMNSHYKCLLNGLHIFFTETLNKDDSYVDFSNFLFLRTPIKKREQTKNNMCKFSKNSAGQKRAINIDYIKTFLNSSGTDIDDYGAEGLIMFSNVLKKLKIRIKRTESKELFGIFY